MHPDDWWHSLPMERREQIYRWVEQPKGGEHAQTPGQRELFALGRTDE
ncbi:hypothetical protein SEA_GEAZY_57 [Gordonia phage GEazy]|nr:hypothetical protein SEA_GEAZY_57 [Gordonia phage GEazy]QDF16766.1 hypothetical protein SEA_HANNAHD_54 [Gordonia phage HannahD]